MPTPASVPAGPTAVFVYGTLLPGHLRWPVLEEHAAGWQDAAVPGRLYDTGRGWPAAVLGGSVRSGPVVPGALVRVPGDRLAEVLAMLDEVEGVPDLFVRVTVETTAGASAWAWAWPHPTADLVPLERWAGRAER